MDPDGQPELRAQIDAVVARIRHIQRRIAGSGQPASQLELHELQRLGQRYGVLAALLRARRGAAGPDAE